MGRMNLLFSAFLVWVFFISHTYQLQSSQTQVLRQVRKHLEFPLALEIWEYYSGDFCNLSSTPHMSIACQDNSVSELKIIGDKHAKVSDCSGFAVPNETLSGSFSIDSFITTLSRLSGLRVLNLVSLGIWGPLPDKIHRLTSLEVLDLSANFLFGSIPPKISTMVKLQTLTLDANCFNDSVPDWMDSFSNLTALSLKNNRFKGQFPASISRIGTLRDIALSHNELSGKLPDLSALTDLCLLDLRDNHFDSELPIMPKGLVTALLSENSFSGEIPAQLGELAQLQRLDLSFNSLTGTPPSALFSMENISYLNLASNMLSGTLPESLRCGDELGFVDISSNKLMGVLPSCLSISSDRRDVKFGGNCFSIDAQHQHQESYCKAASIKGKQSRGKEIGVLSGAIAGAAIVVAFLAFVFFILYRRRRKYPSRGSLEQPAMPKLVQENSSTGLSPELLANARFISQAAKFGTQSSPTYRVFSLEELKEATNNFDQETFLGEGSIGKLYKGKLENGAYVVIRTVTLYRKYSIRNLKLRLDLLSKLRHAHLVSLLGHCIVGSGQDDSSVDRFFLIYDYMSNGNYHCHLSENHLGQVLKWPDRLAVLIGVAKAVHFLHTGVIPGSFNNRLKTNNILLDEHGIAKLSDYGMSMIMEQNEKAEAKKEGGKPWKTKTLEDDVYNFGFIMLESLVGPVVTGKGETFLLNEMASFGSQDGRRRIVDPIVLTTSSQESLSIAVSITSKCLSPEPSARPSFEDVLWNLQYAAQVQATADADQKSDSASRT